MTEFIIPLNLPVRAVELTGSTGTPSGRVLEEMTRWSMNPQMGLANLASDPSLRSVYSAGDQNPSLNAANQQAIEELERERESMRIARELFTLAADELRKATKTVERQLGAMLHDFQQASVELAHSIAAKLVFEEIEDDRFPIANLVHEVISRLNTSSGAVIHLHPDDLALVQAHPSISDSNSDSVSLRFLADSTLARGDCKAKAGEISVIYELRRQIDDIRQQLLSTVSGHAET